LFAIAMLAPQDPALAARLDALRAAEDRRIRQLALPDPA
jgi:hypothetical protein